MELVTKIGREKNLVDKLQRKIEKTRRLVAQVVVWILVYEDKLTLLEREG